MTLNTIIQKLLKPIADDHLMINDFGFGDLSNYATTNEIKYPVMWVVLNNVRYAQKGFSYSFSLVFADMMKDDLSNSVEIQSDQIQVAADVAAKIAYVENDYIEVLNEFNLKPFTERFTDMCAGVVMDFNIKSLKTLTDCDFPSIIEITSPKLLTETGDILTTENDSEINL